MKKIKIGVIFGGQSTEHDVSIVSGTSIIKHLDKDKYDIYPIYIDKDGNWYQYTKDINNINILDIGQTPTEIIKINKIFDLLKKLDVAFPVLHGLYGEDGSIQGLFELVKIPYVGCKILSSCISMDKAYCKIIMEKANIPQTKFLYIKTSKNPNNYILIDKNLNHTKYSSDELLKIIQNIFNFPVFIKPANSGSSIGISKAHNLKELEKSINLAAKYDEKIIIEEAIDAIDMECAILGNEDVIISTVGEIIPDDEFYSFNAKYKGNSGLQIPANISKEQLEKIQQLTKKAFKCVDGKGLARVDFLIDKTTNKIYLSEINTMPGFTNISMYPKLFNHSGISYEHLLDKLIELALN